MLKLLLSIPSSIILYMTGWSYLDYNLKTLINNHDRIVCVFSHSSYYDFFIMVLYYLSHPELSNLKTLIRPDYFDSIGFILKRIGGIPAIRKKNGGGVEEIVAQLKQTDKSHFLISPKGTILKAEWKLGYYHIAQSLKCPIIAIGLDYELKKIIVGDLISYQNDEPFIKKMLYKDLAKIVPLHPEQENMVIRPHKNSSVINKSRLFMMLYILYFFKKCI